MNDRTGIRSLAAGIGVTTIFLISVLFMASIALVTHMAVKGSIERHIEKCTQLRCYGAV
jgi:hypothetical protein